VGKSNSAKMGKIKPALTTSKMSNWMYLQVIAWKEK